MTESLNSLIEELDGIAAEIGAASASEETTFAKRVLSSLVEHAVSIGRASSGSWLGYHAEVYTSDLLPARAENAFDPMRGFLIGSQPNWIGYTFDEIRTAIEKQFSSQDIDRACETAIACKALLSNKRSHVVSIIQACAETGDDFLNGIRSEIDVLGNFSMNDFVSSMSPKGAIVSRDQSAISQGEKIPPHIACLAEYMLRNGGIEDLHILGQKSEQTSAHLKRRKLWKQETRTRGQKIFIGHGRSMLWRELKDFLQGELGLECDEFNRIATEGITITERLSQMLDSASFAFLIMTAEDETADGNMQARMNVIHEAGLFQGRLGFDKAIILLEEGCEQFSNIHGLGHRPFPPGNLQAAFHGIRKLLEERGILKP